MARILTNSFNLITFLRRASSNNDGETIPILGLMLQIDHQ